MSRQQVDLGFLDEPQQDVSVNLDFLNGDEPVKETWRDLQAQRFPTAEERGGKPGEATDAGTKPLLDAPLAFAPLANPGLIWNDRVRRAFKTGVGAAASDLWGAVSTPFKALFSPRQTAEALGTQRERGETRVGQAWQRGDYPYAVTRGALNVLPFGPGVGEILDEAGVDPAAGAGHVAAFAAGGMVAGDATEAVKATPGAMADAARMVKSGGLKNAAIDLMNRRLTPQEQYFKAVRPLNSKLTFERDIDVAMPELKAAADKAGLKIEGIHSLDEAHQLAMDDLVSKQKQLMGNRVIEVSGQPIADAIKKAMPKIFRTENPEDAAGIDEWADKTYGRNFTHEELNELRKDANAAAQGYYGKLPQGQMALDRKVDMAVKVAKGNAIRNTLYDALENQSGTGEAMRDVNLRIRSLLTSQDVLDRRYNVEMRQALQNLPQQVGKLVALGKFGQAAKMLVHGSPAGAALEAATGLGEVALTNLLREANSTNGQIASAFRRLTNVPAPISLSPVSRYQRGLPPAQSTVQPTTETGAGTPNQPRAEQGWNRPTALEMPEDNAARTAADQEAFINQERSRGRLALQSGRAVMRPTEEPYIDVEHEPVQPKRSSEMEGVPQRQTIPESTPTRTPWPRPSSVRTEAGPSGEPIKLKATAASKKADAANEQLKMKDLLKLETADYYIGRDTKTGRWKKIYKSTSKETNK